MMPRIVYDDRETFPWVIVYGQGEVWATYRTRGAAIRSLQALYRLLYVVKETE